MGYILPVNSYQSQQYANRLMDDSHFAKVSRLQRVNQVSSFVGKFEEASEGEKERVPQLAATRSQHEVKGYVNPNPANLSPAISHVVGKGRAINAYV